MSKFLTLNVFLLFTLIIVAFSKSWTLDYNNGKDKFKLTTNDKPKNEGEERPFYDASLDTQAIKNIFNDDDDDKNDAKKTVSGHVRLGSKKLSFEVHPENYIKPLKFLKRFKIHADDDDEDNEKEE